MTGVPVLVNKLYRYPLGDSAGGNLVVSVTLKLIELNIARLPDGLVPIYTPFLFQVLLHFKTLI